MRGGIVGMADIGRLVCSITASGCYRGVDLDGTFIPNREPFGIEALRGIGLKTARQHAVAAAPLMPPIERGVSYIGGGAQVDVVAGDRVAGSRSGCVHLVKTGPRNSSAWSHHAAIVRDCGSGGKVALRVCR